MEFAPVHNSPTSPKEHIENTDNRGSQDKGRMRHTLITSNFPGRAHCLPSASAGGATLDQGEACARICAHHFLALRSVLAKGSKETKVKISSIT